jgi:hypothetical protein
MALNDGLPDNERIEALVRTRARQAMRRAASANLPFDESFVEDSVLAVRQAGYRCKITGRAFDIDYRTPGAGGTHYAPSPDRTIPERGYVRGNVRWVLWCLNRGKGEMSADDYLEVCRLVARYEAEATDVPDEAIERASRGSRTDTAHRTQQPAYTRQQVAAFKAHITMARRSLGGLTGDARTAALHKLARYEARLAAALAPPEA